MGNGTRMGRCSCWRNWRASSGGILVWQAGSRRQAAGPGWDKRTILRLACGQQVGFTHIRTDEWEVGMAKAQGKGPSRKPAVGEIALPGGTVLKVDGDDAAVVGALRWRPHTVAKTGLTYWAARTKAGVTYLGAFVMGLHGVVLKPGQLVIHLNGDLADARRENLVVAGWGLAMQRRVVKKRGGVSQSRYIGVNAVLKKGEPTGKWMAKVRAFNPETRESRTTYLKCWDSEEEAADAYDLAVYQIQGPRARMNFPEDEDEGGIG